MVCLKTDGCIQQLVLWCFENVVFVYFVQHRPRLGQALQYDMDLECHVVAYPPPAITWWKDEVQLSNNQHYRFIYLSIKPSLFMFLPLSFAYISISHFATADEFTDTTLRILTVEKRQYGKYYCRAANKLGSDEASVELFGTPF